jgi:hypothetical protein
MINQETKENTDIVRLNDSLQKLSFDQLIRELGMMKLKLGVIIPLIFEKGKEKGFNEIEIRKRVEEVIDIPERTLNRYQPEGAKQHKYPKNRKLANLANYNKIKEGVPDSEPVLNVLSRSAQKAECVYRNWTLEELIFRYEELEQENFYLDTQLADANARIQELEECLDGQ